MIQYLFPILFVAIWALTSLLSREAEPLPARPAKGGWGPDLGGDKGSAIPATTRAWGGNPSRGGAAASDEIVYLGRAQEARRQPSAPSARPRPGRPARPARSRPAAAAPVVKETSASPRNLSTLVARSLSDAQSRQTPMTPVFAPMPSLLKPLSQPPASSEASPRPATPSPPVTLETIQIALSTPERLRAQLILTEILGPPLTRRLRRRGF
jgi:hypothetical protein